MQTHASMGPSCAVADVRDGEATVWSASQATHRFRHAFAKMLGLPPATVRMIYLDGAGCYGMNGHDDAAADAALLSQARRQAGARAVDARGRARLGPERPAAIASIEGALDANGGIGAWRTEMWLPKATANLPNVPLLAAEAAGIAADARPGGRADHAERRSALRLRRTSACWSHWLKDAPLRPSNIRAPGKIANLFAVESFVDELAVAAGADPVEFRLRGLTDPRGIEVLKRAAALIGWQARATPRDSNGSGRGIAYCHYKHNETYVAMAMEVEVDRASGAIAVQARGVRARLRPGDQSGRGAGAGRGQHPADAVAHAARGSRRSTAARVTSVDWASYPILRFTEVPEILVDIVDRPRLPPLGAGEASAGHRARRARQRHIRCHRRAAGDRAVHARARKGGARLNTGLPRANRCGGRSRAREERRENRIIHEECISENGASTGLQAGWCTVIGTFIAISGNFKSSGLGRRELFLPSTSGRSASTS